MKIKIINQSKCQIPHMLNNAETNTDSNISKIRGINQKGNNIPGLSIRIMLKIFSIT